MFRHLSATKRKFLCHYEVLELTPAASSKEIKISYYEKSKQYHPDLNKERSSTDKFQQVNLAYEILSNDQLRSEYDFSRGYNRGINKQRVYRQDER